jgi:hypothetical protein
LFFDLKQKTFLIAFDGPYIAGDNAPSLEPKNIEN